VTHFLDESSCKKLSNLLIDFNALLFIEATQTLLDWLGARSDLQGVLGDFPQNACYVRGFPCEDESVHAEDVDERAFLFRRERGVNAHHLALGAARVYEDLLGALRGLKGPG
jgi:hypothetical protein